MTVMTLSEPGLEDTQVFFTYSSADKMVPVSFPYYQDTRLVYPSHTTRIQG